jgi:hypothetical protein
MTSSCTVGARFKKKFTNLNFWQFFIDTPFHSETLVVFPILGYCQFPTFPFDLSVGGNDIVVNQTLGGYKCAAYT